MDPLIGFLVFLILVIIIAAVVLFLIDNAPFFEPTTKKWLRIVVWCLVALVLLRRAIPLLAAL